MCICMRTEWRPAFPCQHFLVRDFYCLHVIFSRTRNPDSISYFVKTSVAGKEKNCPMMATTTTTTTTTTTDLPEGHVDVDWSTWAPPGEGDGETHPILSAILGLADDLWFCPPSSPLTLPSPKYNPPPLP
ncbi:hypothetical protein EJ03DRAFT_116341 [Teratosphaeria nubilosa]|uniref:Uncharacterized protein n=1 Tax=Teratosphaeria nubilosa TaxID=161662 RepID=A0A6G1L721_9PEZI|nr:hypothetical protein EJ03DRAFT_116341 [Teratosphaeria nubilosa]